jgi:hypothetical protein
LLREIACVDLSHRPCCPNGNMIVVGDLPGMPTARSNC